jgi:hypothetical protein
MQICKFIDNKPAEIQTLPSAWRNISNPTLANMAGDGWRPRRSLGSTRTLIRRTTWSNEHATSNP